MIVGEGEITCTASTNVLLIHISKQRLSIARGSEFEIWEQNYDLSTSSATVCTLH